MVDGEELRLVQTVLPTLGVGIERVHRGGIVDVPLLQFRKLCSLSFDGLDGQGVVPTATRKGGRYALIYFIQDTESVHDRG